MKLPEGAIYRGDIVDGKRHGKGTLTWPDGSCYSGEWKEGLYHGYGVYTFANGEKYEGFWQEERCMAREPIILTMVAGIVEIGKTMPCTVRGPTTGPTGDAMRERFPTVLMRVGAAITGPMGVNIRVNGKIHR